MNAILNKILPAGQAERALAPRMPGLKPLAMSDWVQVTEVYAEQMAERRRLIAERRSDVLADVAELAQVEILDLVLAVLAKRGDFMLVGDEMICPDGVAVTLDRLAPLETLAQIIQEDICLLVPCDGEYVMRAAVLCFPASWTLAEKINRPLLGIHDPVASYTQDLAKRVQRLFEAIRPESAMWRANALFYEDPSLYQPRQEADPRLPEGDAPNYLRSERQSLLRLPKTGAVAFTIHTYVVAREDLDPAVVTALEA